MSIIITNSHLLPVCGLLTRLPLAGSASRARSKVLAMANAAAQSLAESEYALALEHAVLDTDGQPEVDGDGTIRFPTSADALAFMAARAELMAEQAELSGPSYTTMVHTLHDALVNLDERLSGEEADAYDHLLNALEAHLNTGDADE